MGFLLSWEHGVLSAALEPVAFAVHLQDVDVVGEPVQQNASEALRAEDLGPLVEGQVGGHNCGTPFVALAEDLEYLERHLSLRAVTSQTVDKINASRSPHTQSLVSPENIVRHHIPFSALLATVPHLVQPSDSELLG